MKIMYEHVNKRNGKWSPLLADDVYEIIKEVRTGEPPYPKKLPLRVPRGGAHISK